MFPLLGTARWSAGAGETSTTASGGDRRRLYTKPAPMFRWHRPACPDQVWLHPESGRGDQAAPPHASFAQRRFSRRLRPLVRVRVVAVECRFPWSWLADLGAPHGSAFVLGHALDLQAMPGGTANNATIDAHQIAVLRRGGRRPQAYSSLRLRCGRHRDRLRRRVPLEHVNAPSASRASQQTNRQDHLPARRPQLASQAPREGGAERCPEPAAQTSVAVALALMHA